MTPRLPAPFRSNSPAWTALLLGFVAFGTSCALYNPRPADRHALRAEVMSFTQQESHFALWETSNPSPEELTLQEAAAMALSNNAELRSRYIRFESLVQQAPRAGALPDPIPDVQDLSAESRQSDIRATLVVVKQRLPGFGKRGLRRALSEKEALENLDRYHAFALDLRHRLARAWYELAYHDAARELEQQEEELSARTRGALAGAGASDGPEPMPRRPVAIHDAERAGELRTEILELIGVDDARFSPAFPPTEAVLRPLPPESELLLLASHNRPELDRLARLNRIGDISSRLARREPLPDFAVGIGYATVGDAETGAPTPLIEGHGDAWEASAGISIPLPGPRQREIKEAARLSAAEARAEYQRTEQQIHEEVQHLLARMAMIQQELLALEYTEVPAALRSYNEEIGREDGPNPEQLLVLERNLIEGRRELLDARREYYFAFSDLERAVGLPL